MSTCYVPVTAWGTLKIISDIYDNYWKIIPYSNLQMKQMGLRECRYLAQGQGAKSERSQDLRTVLIPKPRGLGFERPRSITVP